MWKPTKAGVYLWCNRAREVVVEPWGEIIVGHGPWSLLAPDWQPGAPTPEQLDKWNRWAVVSVGGDLVIGSWSAHVSHSGTLVDIMTSNGRRMDVDNVTRSAPVQPVPGEVLWVPLEVTK